MTVRPHVKYLLSVLFLIVFIIGANAQAKQPALFKLQTDKSVIYFFGSIHFGSPEMYPLDNKVLTAFDGSDNLVVEINIMEMDMQEVMSLMQQSLTYQKDDSLDKHLPAGYMKKLEAILAEIGIPMAGMKLFKPVAVDLTINEYVIKAMGYQEENGIDLYFLNRATDDGKKILELESYASQIKALASIPDSVQLMMLVTTLNRRAKIEQETKAVIDAWKIGDVNRLHELSVTQYREDPTLSTVYQILYTQRHQQMKQKLVEMITKGGTYFVVIGAGHLAGPDSVIELLKKEGYIVTRQ